MYLIPRSHLSNRSPVLFSEVAASAAPAEDDPYKDYVVPDDLKW